MMSFAAWSADSASSGDAQTAFRASVARGAALVQTRTIWVKDVYNFNTLGVGNPQKRNCVGCHNMAMTGLDIAPGYMDLGTTNLPHAEPADDLPLFKLTCSPTARPHPYLGRVIHTHDPGRALITGRCREIGAITMQQFRGLAARAPYFSNGSASTLREVIEIYDRRFDMRLTEQEKQDMVNFLGVL
jgi:cytochrome c peroxidase